MDSCDFDGQVLRDFKTEQIDHPANSVLVWEQNNFYGEGMRLRKQAGWALRMSSGGPKPLTGTVSRWGRGGLEAGYWVMEGGAMNWVVFPVSGTLTSHMKRPRQ